MVRWYVGVRFEMWRAEMKDRLWHALARWGFRVGDMPHPEALHPEHERWDNLL